MEFTFDPGGFGVHTLTAPYALLVEAFGDNGLTTLRDDYKSMAQWDLDVPKGEDVEIYDYKVGKCYAPDGADLKDITTWHVQGTENGIAHMLRLLRAVGTEV